MRRPPFALPPSADDLADMAERALAAMPARLSRHVKGVGIVVDDIADDETLDEMGIENAWELTGLYRGVPLIHRSHSDIARQPDMIHLYREPILLEWIETNVDLYKLVRNVLVHEIAHHFGFSDAEIEALEAELD
ncbi:MAG TPA: metallopeptidase family protein [Acidisphaera sp.]|nr:metallopeptidase family protein [Acidisphaera sp.]